MNKGQGKTILSQSLLYSEELSQGKYKDLFCVFHMFWLTFHLLDEYSMNVIKFKSIDKPITSLLLYITLATK